jgi:hypothetical protein
MMGRGNAPQYQIVMCEMLWMKCGVVFVLRTWYFAPLGLCGVVFVYGGRCPPLLYFAPLGLGDDVLGMRK